MTKEGKKQFASLQSKNKEKCEPLKDPKYSSKHKKKSTKRSGKILPNLPKMSKGIKSTLSSLNMKLSQANQTIFSANPHSTTYDSIHCKPPKTAKAGRVREYQMISLMSDIDAKASHQRTSTTKHVQAKKI